MPRSGARRVALEPPVEVGAALMDDLAPEQLEVLAADDDRYHGRFRSYGSLFLGPWSTVAYSDKGMAGTNHTLPTAGGAKHSGGLSVARFLKPLTYKRIARAATPDLAEAVDVISASEGMAAHRDGDAAPRAVPRAGLTDRVRRPRRGEDVLRAGRGAAGRPFGRSRRSSLSPMSRAEHALNPGNRRVSA